MMAGGEAGRKFTRSVWPDGERFVVITRDAAALERAWAEAVAAVRVPEGSR
jgi:hypothetical protein